MKIIYPPTIHWEGSLVFQRPQQLMKAFSKAGHRAVFMEYGRYDQTIYFCDGVEITDCRSLLPKGDESTVLWVSHPPYYRFKQIFHADLLVFDYIDEAAEEFAVWNNLDLQEAMRNADLITVVSKRLYDQVQMLYPHKPMLLLPNAADYEHFCSAKQQPCPLDMTAIPRPILGFMGSIASWIDTKLIAQVATQRPDWSFVFIGNDYIGMNQIFADYPNVYFLGRKLYHELPSYVGQFSAGLVPFEVRNMTHSSSPIKMYEYMAAGVPVIATPIKEAVECKYVTTGATATEWIEQIEQILTTETTELQTFAETESWGTRIKQIEPLLSQIAKEKSRKQVLRHYSFPVTTPVYWDIRFLTDWENLNGRNQTAFFANLILQHLPDKIRSEIKNSTYQIGDIGCALGDSLGCYASEFPSCRIIGIDFSTEAILKANQYHHGYSFINQSIASISERYDVLICSNVLALFEDPIPVVKQLLDKVKHYLILLVPFKETNTTIENQFTFTEESFPISLGDYQLTFFEEIQCATIPQTFCQSTQALLVYHRTIDK